MSLRCPTMKTSMPLGYCTRIIQKRLNCVSSKRYVLILILGSDDQDLFQNNVFADSRKGF